MKKDLDLVKICSFLFFDGHLYDTLKCFYFSSNDLGLLKVMAKIVERKFKIKGKLYLNDGGINKDTHKYRVFSKKLGVFLSELGVPSGSKTIKPFKFPAWILSNKSFSREFVKIAYLCEGSMKENRKNPRIKFNISKEESLVEDGLRFLEAIRSILKKNKIETTPIGVYPRPRRKDGLNVRELRFRVLTKDNNTFINEIGWLK